MILRLFLEPFWNLNLVFKKFTTRLFLILHANTTTCSKLHCSFWTDVSTLDGGPLARERKLLNITNKDGYSGSLISWHLCGQMNRSTGNFESTYVVIFIEMALSFFRQWKLLHTLTDLVRCYDSFWPKKVSTHERPALCVLNFIEPTSQFTKWTIVHRLYIDYSS